MAQLVTRATGAVIRPAVRVPDFVSRWAPVTVVSVTILLLWQIFVWLDLGKMPLPGPLAVLEAIGSLGSTSEFWTAAGQTLLVMVQGFIPGVLVGVPLGIAIGNVRWLNASLGPLVFAVYTTPFIALVPLLLIIFGFGITGKSMIVFTLVVITVVLQTLAGVQRIDPGYWEVASSFQAGLRHRWLEIALPGAMPYIVVGIRLALGRALVGVVVAEFQSSVTGLGGLILSKAERLELAEAVVPALLLAAIGIVLNVALRAVEDRLRVWKE